MCLFNGYKWIDRKHTRITFKRRKIRALLVEISSSVKG